jgi:hypothetical protein
MPLASEAALHNLVTSPSIEFLLSYKKMMRFQDWSSV